ncbi:16S ribosomal RNA methyltransferase KsgA/Dim1 family protein [Bordetella ansorpii]|jgi:phosphatidylethanolamine/phosphatidyl-N-methylethanolamine N-methyltransferase|uniref:16S ribosomal RNA methyltransferase KsgA/Dim1 family protein n=1 Tax=Bordetella ansorpii TaxID=288768 RepID=A0A157RP92_9BORD|nr:methyltransferase domain-containing protein [Bordetella ansorpii]SAI59758.1 16S ribosomal RNA methyltransferase KsgA/Dim1 family protein [Bordetella ansorpii]
MTYRVRQHLDPLYALFGVFWQRVSQCRPEREPGATSRWLAEQWNFYRAWRANPKGIGAVLPSSPALAAAITSEIRPEDGPVLELGSGTGVFTRALLARGVPQEDLALIEMDETFARQLAERFPRAEVCQADAGKLMDVPLFGGRQAASAVCGLPLLNFPVRQQAHIMRGTFSHLQPGGACYLFTYGWRCPISPRVLSRLGLRARRTRVVYLNVPPAQVWKITRRRRWID